MHITYHGYSDFDVFQNKLYWSCQPAAENNDILVSYYESGGTGSYISDDVDRARDTKIYMSDLTPHNVSSGSDGLFNRLTINGTGWPWNISWNFAENAVNQNISYTKHEGNNTRTGTINRVRCVYRTGPKTN